MKTIKIVIDGVEHEIFADETVEERIQCLIRRNTELYIGPTLTREEAEGKREFLLKRIVDLLSEKDRTPSCTRLLNSFAGQYEELEYVFELVIQRRDQLRKRKNIGDGLLDLLLTYLEPQGLGYNTKIDPAFLEELRAAARGQK